MGIVAGGTAIIGTILAILTFYFSTYLPYINGDNTAATETFTPVLEAIPNAKSQHDTKQDPTPPSKPDSLTARNNFKRHTGSCTRYFSISSRCNRRDRALHL